MGSFFCIYSTNLPLAIGAATYDGHHKILTERYEAAARPGGGAKRDEAVREGRKGPKGHDGFVGGLEVHSPEQGRGRRGIVGGEGEPPGTATNVGGRGGGAGDASGDFAAGEVAEVADVSGEGLEACDGAGVPAEERGQDGVADLAALAPGHGGIGEIGDAVCFGVGVNVGFRDRQHWPKEPDGSDAGVLDFVGGHSGEVGVLLFLDDIGENVFGCVVGVVAEQDGRWRRGEGGCGCGAGGGGDVSREPLLARVSLVGLAHFQAHCVGAADFVEAADGEWDAEAGAVAGDEGLLFGGRGAVGVVDMDGA